jgi:hypothetical protein
MFLCVSLPLCLSVCRPRSCSSETAKHPSLSSSVCTTLMLLISRTRWFQLSEHTFSYRKSAEATTCLGMMELSKISGVAPLNEHSVRCLSYVLASLSVHLCPSMSVCVWSTPSPTARAPRQQPVWACWSYPRYQALRLSMSTR